MEQTRLLDELSERVRVTGARARSLQRLRRPAGPYRDVRDEPGGARAQAAHRRGAEAMTQRPKGSGLVVHHREPMAQGPLDAARDAPLVIEERLEAGLRQ